MIKHHPKDYLVHATSWLSLWLLAACSIIPQAEAPMIYRLPSTPSALPSVLPDSISLRIAAPDATSFLDSPRIAVLPNGDHLTSYKGVRWSDRAPLLLRNRLYDAFQATGKIAALSMDENSVHADLELSGTLRSFQSEYREGRPMIVIRYDALLTSTSAHRIIAARRFDVQLPITGEAIPEVVKAFGLGCDQLSAQVVPWVMGSARTQPKKSP